MFCVLLFKRNLNFDMSKLHDHIHNWKVYKLQTPFKYECDHALYSYQSLSFFWKALVTYRWIIDVASHISVVINQLLLKLWGNIKKRKNTVQLRLFGGQLMSEFFFQLQMDDFIYGTNLISHSSMIAPKADFVQIWPRNLYQTQVRLSPCLVSSWVCHSLLLL